jgi:hypothetical protein
MIMQTIARKLVTAFTLLASASATLSAQEVTAAEEKEIAAYRLTTENWTKLHRAMRAVIDAAKRDPKIREQLMKDDEDSETLDDMTISQLAKKASEIKPFADALRQAGMTTREYAIWTMAYLEAAMVVSMKQTGMTRDIPKDANLANAKFVEDHMADILAIQKEFERLTKKDP